MPARIWPYNDSPAPLVERSDLPISTLGGLIARFKATPELVGLAPGGMLPGVPAGPRALPYVVATHLGGDTRIAVGGRLVRVREDRFRLAVTTTGATAAEDAEAIREAMEMHFNPMTVAADPIELRGGRVVSAWADDARMEPGPGMPDKGGVVVRRLLVEMGTITTRVTT